MHLELPHFEDLDNWATTEVMFRTDCVIGVHGAGWTNTIWLRPNTSALQVRAEPFVLQLASKAADGLWCCCGAVRIMCRSGQVLLM